MKGESLGAVWRWMVLTNCLRERRRLVMNLRVRRVTAVLALESAMVGRWKLDAPPRGREGELGAREERVAATGVIGGGKSEPVVNMLWL